jgi:two-component system sensor histidine kinase AgrC
MESLNNLYACIHNENETLIDLISIPALIVESCLTLLLFTSILHISATKKQKILYVILVSITGFVSEFLITTPFNIFANYILMFILIKCIFHMNILKTLVSILFSVFTFTLTTLLFATLFLNIFDITLTDVNLIPAYRIAYLISTYFIILCIALIINHKRIHITIMEELDKKNKIIIFTNLLLGFFTLAIQVSLIGYYSNNLPLVFSILSFLSLLSYFFISIYSINKVKSLTIKTRELESSEAYNKSLTILHDSVRGFKHDFDNIVATIGGYISINDMDGLKNYYYSLRNDCQNSNNLATLNPSIINNPGIYSLLSSKYHTADEKNIKINLDFFIDLNELNVNIYEFSRMLGILLDNAIDAASECEEKIINIKFKNERNKNRHTINIENTYKNKDVNTEDIFNKGISGKENHTGLGLWEVRKYINKSKNLNLFTTKNEKYFIQQFEIYYTPNKAT